MVPFSFAFLCMAITRAMRRVPVIEPPIERIWMKSVLCMRERKANTMSGGMVVRIHAVFVCMLRSRWNISVRAIERPRQALNMVMQPRMMKIFPRAMVAIFGVAFPNTPITIMVKSM